MISSVLKIYVFALLVVLASCESELHGFRARPSSRKNEASQISTRTTIGPNLIATPAASSLSETLALALAVPRGGGYFPAGWHPFGYGISELGLEFLQFEGSLDCDIGRFLASLKSGRKKQPVLKEQWLEVVRVSKTGQSMRILRTLSDLIAFCLKVGFIN